ncbi:MAG: HNH endonuclease [Anaerolineales bacterium]
MTKCYICGKEFDSADMEKDHVPPGCFFPDNNKPDNLFSVKCCRSCHDKFDVIDERMRNIVAILSGSKSGEVGERSLRVFKRSPKLLNQFLAHRKEHPTLVYNDGNPKAHYFFEDKELDCWLTRIVRGLYFKKFKVILSP